MTLALRLAITTWSLENQYCWDIMQRQSKASSNGRKERGGGRLENCCAGCHLLRNRYAGKYAGTGVDAIYQIC